MSSIDFSLLGGLQPVEGLDLAEYKDNRESKFLLPAADTYLLKSPDGFGQEAFSRANKGAGALLVQVDPTIADGPHAGYTLKFQRVSAKTFERGGQKVSILGDYLRAHGIKARYSNEAELAELVQSTANGVYRAVVDWKAADFKTGFELRGMKNFPKNAGPDGQPDGTYQSWALNPNDIDSQTGQAKRVPARLEIVKFLPAAD